MRRLDSQCTRAVEVIVGHSGKIVVTGLGSSGRVGQKIVSTFSSAGTPAVFLHPAEAVAHNLAPTSSAAVAMALGDALAVTVMRERRFTPEEFAMYHPAGQLGQNLALTVREVMHSGDQAAWTGPLDPVKQVVIAMSARSLGAACVIGEDGCLLGIVTDGDLRRALQAHDDIRPLKAADIMTARPVTIAPDARLHEALRLMEDRPSQISVLPVVDPATRRCLGLLRLHDIYHGR